VSPYPRRLIEVDLPIKEISAHARREKSIRHGHISTLHIWWARRPLAACRSVILAALWPDPADPLCPERFRIEAANVMKEWRNCRGGRQRDWGDPAQVRAALLDFIAEFANWDNSTNAAHLETARRLVQAAHESLGGAPGTRPLVVDPFAGGGAIPLEALRVGADAFASDLNPVAVLLNKVVLEYIPKHGSRLAEEVRRWGAWVKKQAEKELARFYPKDDDGAVPIAYLWARTIRCEGPGCGAEVPLMRSLWLSKKRGRPVAMRLLARADATGVDVEIVEKPRAADAEKGTVRRGSATCPCCDYTTPVKAVREQLKARRGGAADPKLLCVVTTRPSQAGRYYRLPNARDVGAIQAAEKELAKRRAADHGPMSLVPDEPIDVRGIRHTWGMIYGFETWGDLFTPRQALAMSTLARLAREASERCKADCDAGLAEAVRSVLGLAVSRFGDICNANCVWENTKTQVRHLFTRQALPMVWDFAEPYVFADAAGDFSVTLGTMIEVLERCTKHGAVASGHAEGASATAHPLPDDAAHAFITDPPYYDAVPYAYLSDFFYVWLRRSLHDLHPGLFGRPAVPKDEEIVVDRPHELSNSTKDIAFYEENLRRAFEEGRRVLMPSGVGTVVFASKTTASWEAILQAMVDAGWVITASWPIDTELANRVAAQGQARLGSSIHLVCRPRENPDGSVQTDAIGDWRAVLRELPVRIHEWMPRLAKEGVVGADAIFACLGPALEIFSRYSRVEKASGERVELREYLEQVWAAVAREALSMIFEDADATGLEEDARLTAMWLWTTTSAEGGRQKAEVEEETDDGEDSAEEERNFRLQPSHFSLEFDAARKIAQGLGAHLEDLGRVVEIKGDKARLLSVAERTRHLFGKDQAQRAPARRAKKVQQLTLFEELDAAEKDAGWGDVGLPPAGETTLDRVHQAMVLFATGRGEALKRFLVEEGVGRAPTFWKLAQSLSALYPAGTDEKRWVDGVLARKKGLGFG
jgi:adenine-specific DNA methylase